MLRRSLGCVVAPRSELGTSAAHIYLWLPYAVRQRYNIQGTLVASGWRAIKHVPAERENGTNGDAGSRSVAIIHDACNDGKVQADIADRGYCLNLFLCVSQVDTQLIAVPLTW